MAFTLDTSARIPSTANTTSTANPVTGSYTCGATADVLVVGLLYAAGTRSGTPTYNGLNLTQADTAHKGTTSPECYCEIWYLLHPPTGSSYTLNVPNANGLAMAVHVATFVPTSGKQAGFDAAHGVDNATGTNPADSITRVVQPNIVFGMVANGAQSWNPTPQTLTALFNDDNGSWGGGSGYLATAATGALSVSWTFGTSEDNGVVLASFRDVSPTWNGVASPVLASTTTTAAILGITLPATAGPTLASSTPNTVTLDVAIALDPPVSSVLDAFTRADADTLGASWGGPFGTTQRYNLGVLSNRVAPTWITTGGSGTITITSPVAYQTFQRNGSNKANIPISGTYTGSPVYIQARWAGGPWTVIDFAPSAGAFRGVLIQQSAGQGTLEVRFTNATGVSASVSYVGIGDIFIIGGQSNAVGMTAGNQTYSHATLKAANFKNNYTWADLTDPVDSSTGQVDTVSSDAAGGSYYPLLATSFMASQSVPCAFVPCAKGGTQISDWAVPTNHQDRSTLFGSMVYRTLQISTPGIPPRCCLWWQGESDVINATTRASYASQLETVANTYYADTGVKLVVCKLEDMSNAGVWTGNEATVNLGIGDAWAAGGGVLQGPDLSVWTPNGDIHYSSTEAPSIRTYWWDRLKALYGWT